MSHFLFLESANETLHALAQRPFHPEAVLHLAEVALAAGDEIQAIKEMLNAATDLLKVGGRLSVISYHSLEDRLVKNLVKKGNIEGNLQKDFYGNPFKKFKEISKKVIIPSEKEIKNNPRARSAKLRIAETL